MLFETLQVSLLKPCPDCGSNMLRCLRAGTHESDEYGTTHSLQVWDRCDSCLHVFGHTHIGVHDTDLENRVTEAFSLWVARRIDDAEFTMMIQTAFSTVGGWAMKSG